MSNTPGTGHLTCPEVVHTVVTNHAGTDTAGDNVHTDVTVHTDAYILISLLLLMLVMIMIIMIVLVMMRRRMSMTMMMTMLMKRL